ncbi:D-alanyl-D-alanine carboxypeptidase family protein [Longibaculum muris]|uniref:M15 family metallopeptidase n=1 Tax=Longibaculum muris TaxID=1796628 RepID=UPI0012B8458D|nr:M15 family metallopeptidase [Longibaculum muris]
MQKYKHPYSHKKHISPVFFLILAFIIILAGIGYLQKNRIQLLIKGYNFTEQNMILQLDEQDIQTYIKNDKIENLEKWKTLSQQHHYLDYSLYQKQHPQTNAKDVVTYIDQFYKLYQPKLNELGYPKNILLQMMQNASLQDFAYLTQQELPYHKTKEYLSIKGVIYQDLDKYIQSKKKPLDAVLSISYPFISSPQKVNQTYIVNEPESLTLLIKKGFQLPSSYIPNDLKDVNIPIAKDCENKQLRKEAGQALEKMYQDALKENLHLVINSGYRSFQQQKAIYDDYFQKYDAVTAAGLVAIPGSSEHQLGLSVDLTSQSVINGQWRFFGDTPEYKWVIENAHHYGYILRYPQNKSHITGTTNEPWHFRYVGQKAAKIIYENNWTLEDYVLHYGLSSSTTLQKSNRK